MHIIIQINDFESNINKSRRSTFAFMKVKQNSVVLICEYVNFA